MIAENIARIKAELQRTLDAIGDGNRAITLVSVTKTQPVEAVEAALNSGITDIGENKVQEAMRKIPMLQCGKGMGNSDSPQVQETMRFHFIGHLQNNKINQLLSLKPYLIHSVDSLYLARNLHLALGRTNRTQDILVQINSSEEEAKSGFGFDDAGAAIEQISQFTTLRIRGLMTIGKLDEPEVSRPLFAGMKKLFEAIKTMDLPNVKMDYLSMGMSHDYIIALEEGANMIRIGTGIFGMRNYGGVL